MMIDPCPWRDSNDSSKISSSLSAHSVPGTILSTFCPLPQWILKTTQIHSWRNWGTERLVNLLKTTQLIQQSDSWNSHSPLPSPGLPLGGRWSIWWGRAHAVLRAGPAPRCAVNSSYHCLPFLENGNLSCKTHPPIDCEKRVSSRAPQGHLSWFWSISLPICLFCRDTVNHRSLSARQTILVTALALLSIIVTTSVFGD